MIKIDNTNEEKNKTSFKEFLKNNSTTRNILINIAYSAIIMIYFIIFNLQYPTLNEFALKQFIRISTLAFLGISIIMLEIGFRKDSKSVFVNGIEFAVLATFILLIQHMPKILECNDNTYILIGSYLFAIYYILKSGILYTKEKQDELKSLSDIKEIVKEEPTKKATKRKNVKKEEGK